MVNLNLVSAFVAGFITFFASCLAPLTPAFIAFLAGISPKDQKSKLKLLYPTLLFILGFMIVFLIFGLMAGKIGNQFRNYRHIGNLIGGSFLIIFGLHTTGFLKISFLLKEFHLPKLLTSKNSLINALLFGLTFGFAWTPCIGPILGSILLLAASTPAQAVPLLLSFGLGLSIPYLLLALGFEPLSHIYMKSGRIGRIFQIISGTILILMGISLVTGKVSLITIFISRLLQLPTLTM